MTEAELMKPEILRMQIIEVMALRKFTHNSGGPSNQVRTIEDLLSQICFQFILRHSIKETSEVILNLARQGYPELALGYLPRFTTMYEELPIDDTILTTG